MYLDKLFDVTGKVVLVTGGASGIGLGIAQGLAIRGARLIVADVDADGLEAARESIGGDVMCERLDVTDRQAVDALFHRTVARAGRVDAVFANAGIAGSSGFSMSSPEGNILNPDGFIDAISDDEWARVIAVNLAGARNTCAAAARVMKAGGNGGRIILTSSVAASINITYVSTAYHASKAGVSHLMRQLAIELAPHGILVNAISPANFITNIGGGGMYIDAIRDLFARNALLKRTAEVDEIVGLAVFLASNASSYLTGADIPIDGGTSLIGPS